MNEEWVNVEKDPDRNKAVIRTVVAKSFIRNFGDRAIMMAMAEMLSDDAVAKKTADHWKAIVNEIARLQNGNE